MYPIVYSGSITTQKVFPLCPPIKKKLSPQFHGKFGYCLRLMLTWNQHTCRDSLWACCVDWERKRLFCCLWHGVLTGRSRYCLMALKLNWYSLFAHVFAWGKGDSTCKIVVMEFSSQLLSKCLNLVSIANAGATSISSFSPRWTRLIWKGVSVPISQFCNVARMFNFSSIAEEKQFLVSFLRSTISFLLKLVAGWSRVRLVFKLVQHED